MSAMPKVSVVIPSYNHEDFVRECIASILAQTYADLEIVVTDDGSQDRTLDRIREFNDPRIVVFSQPHRGACCAINNSIAHAGGEYIAVMNSDDAWESAKLEKQVAFMDEHPGVGAVFSRARFVDDRSAAIPSEQNPYSGIFDEPNRTRHEWLRRFFYQGNCLCHSSALVRRLCFDKLGLYDERMANLPDFDMWVRLCFAYEIHILDEVLVRYRVRGAGANASADTPETRVRLHFEYKQILDHYLRISDSADLERVFPEASKYGNVDDARLPYFLGMMALEGANPARELWGLEVLFRYLNDKDAARELEASHGFRYLDLLRLTGEHDPFRIAATAPITGRSALSRLKLRMHGRLSRLLERL